MNILVPGGSGFLGRAVCAALVQAGERVTVLSRRPDRVRDRIPAVIEVLGWDTAGSDPDARWLERLPEVDAVINLSGANVGGHGRLPARWSPGVKAGLRSSRLQSTRAIVQGLAATPAARRPRILINASAVGYYGDRGDEVLTELSQSGSDYFSDLCRAWEAEALAAEPLDVRVVCLRTGVVLDRGAMATDLLVAASRLGAGGRLGSGRQWWSWIHREDVAGLIRHALHGDAVRGPLNLVAPNPRRMEDFPRVLGALLRRPSWLPTPAWALRLVFGELADALLLSSQRVLPARAEQTGYTFQYATLEAALSAVVRPAARASRR
jgi:uncharacterized protein (TIGR01777 family)